MTTTTSPTADATAIAQSLVSHLEQSWNRADGAAFGEAFGADSDFVDVRGVHHRGRAAIAAGHQDIFDSIYAGSTVRYEVDGARRAGPGCIVAVVSATLDAPHGPLQGINHARLTVVIIEATDGWVIDAFHNTLVTGDG